MEKNELERATRERGGRAQEGLGNVLGTPEDQIAGRIKQASTRTARPFNGIDR